MIEKNFNLIWNDLNAGTRYEEGSRKVCERNCRSNWRFASSRGWTSSASGASVSRATPGATNASAKRCSEWRPSSPLPSCFQRDDFFVVSFNQTGRNRFGAFHSSFFVFLMIFFFRLSLFQSISVSISLWLDCRWLCVCLCFFFVFFCVLMRLLTGRWWFGCPWAVFIDDLNYLSYLKYLKINGFLMDIGLFFIVRDSLNSF